MATLLGKSLSFCSSSVLSENVLLFCVFSFPPAVYVGTLNLIAPIPGPSILILVIPNPFILTKTKLFYSFATMMYITHFFTQVLQVTFDSYMMYVKINTTNIKIHESCITKA